MTRLDWEKAAKMDYVRKHGADHVAPERPRLRPQDTKTGRKLAAAFRDKVRPLINEFRALAPEKRIERVDEYCDAIARISVAERESLTPYKQRFAVAIEKASKQAKGEIKGLATRAKKRPTALLSRQAKKPANKKHGRGPTVPVVRGTAKRLLSELPQLEVSYLRSDGSIRFDWKPFEDTSNWFLTLGPEGKDPIYRESLAADVLTASVADVDAMSGSLAMTLVALRRGKPVARTHLTIR